MTLRFCARYCRIVDIRGRRGGGMNWIASTQLSLFAGFLAAVATILMVRRFRLLRQISVHRLDQAADVAFILFVLVLLVIWGALNLGKF